MDLKGEDTRCDGKEGDKPEDLQGMKLKLFKVLAQAKSRNELRKSAVKSYQEQRLRLSHGREIGNFVKDAAKWK